MKTRTLAILVIFAAAAIAAPALVHAQRLSPQGGSVVKVDAAAGGGLVVTGTTAKPLVGLVTTCSSGQTLIWGGSAWACGAPGATYTAGTGLSLAGTTFSVDPTYTQRRVSGTCAAGSSIRVVAEDGTVTCEADTDTDTTYTAGDGLSLTGTEFAVDITGASCSAGQYVSALSSTGTGTCTAEVGDISAVTASTGLSGGGTSGAVSLAVDYTATQRRVSGTCAAGSSIRAIAADGTVTCESDDSGVADGDYGDVAVSSSGTVWTVESASGPFSAAGKISALGGLGFGTHGSRPELASSGGGTYLQLNQGDGFVPMSTDTGALGITSQRWKSAAIGTGGLSVLGLITAGNSISLTGTLTANSTSGSEGEVLTIVDGLPKWAEASGPVVQVVSTTGTINDLALNADTTVLDFTGASATTISGMTGGVDGRCVRIIRSGGSVLDITHEAGASTTTNRFSNSGAVTWRSHPNETITACYSGSTSRWYIDARRQLASLTVTGSTSLVSHVTVGSNSNANLTINAKINSHVYYTGTAPTITSCGTGATIAGNDRRGAIDVGSGNPANCTIGFASAYTNAPVCVVSSRIGTATVTSVSTSAVTFVATDMSGEQIFYYHCDGIL